MGFQPYGLDVAGLVGDTLGQGASQVILRKVTETTRNPSARTSGTNPTTADYPCFDVASRSTSDLPGELVTHRIVKFGLLATSLPAGIEPTSGDRVVDGAKVYEIVSANLDVYGAVYEVLAQG